MLSFVLLFRFNNVQDTFYCFITRSNKYIICYKKFRIFLNLVNLFENDLYYYKKLIEI